MAERISALLVYHQDQSFEALKRALQNQGVQAREAHSCASAQAWIELQNSPHIIFTDTILPDGTWEDILRLATKAPRPLPVIVVSRLVDIDLYVHTLESGAADFVVPPFLATDLAYIVRCAVGSRTQNGISVTAHVRAA